jgi:predicted metal-dependent enzyme (double-stranded beta helix superfamily)
VSPHVLNPVLPVRTSLALGELAALTRHYAAEVHAGRHRIVVDPVRRWYHLLRSDETVDVWLITWSTEQAAELHDHGSSLGALTVVGGALTEERWTPGRSALRCRRLGAGRTVGFGRGYIHEVSNPAVQPAVSVHAYSPPLSTMSYYTVDGAQLRRTHTAYTEQGSTEGVG